MYTMYINITGLALILIFACRWVFFLFNSITDFHKPVDVERCDNLREGEILSNGTRDSDLIDGQVGVRCDDGTGGKVHSLPHQVATDTTLFGLQSLLDGLEWSTTSLHSLRMDGGSHVNVTYIYHMT